MHPLSNIFAIGLAGVVLAMLAFDLRRGVIRVLSGRSAVLVAVMYWYVLEALRVPKDLEIYTQSEYNFGLLCVLVSVVAFLVAYHQSHLELFNAIARRLPILDDSRVLLQLVLAGMTIGLGSLLIYVDFSPSAFFDGITGLSARWTGALVRGRYGSWRTVLYEMQMFLEASLPLAVALAFKKEAPIGRRVFSALFVVWMILRQFSTGARTPLVPIVLCICAAIFWRSGARVRRMLIVVGIPVGLVAGYFVAAMIVAGRNEGKLELDAAKTEYVGTEMFRELLFVIHAEDHGMSPQYGLTYFTQLVNPIPRAIWPGKPVADAGLILARAYGAVYKSGEPTMTIAPGFLGEAYMNFWFLGLIIVPAVAGVVVRAWDRLLPIALKSLPCLLVYATGLARIYASGRSVNFATFYGLFALFALLIALDKIRRSSSGPPRRQPVVVRRGPTIGTTFPPPVTRYKV